MSLSLVLFLILLVAGLLLALAAWRTTRLSAAAARLVPQTGQLQPVAGGAIHYTDTGPRDAQAVVLIHGLSGQLQHFDYGIIEDLSRDFRVIAVDRPGCGYSTRDTADLADPRHQGRMIDEALVELGVDRPVVVGHSLGGAVALCMAMDRPERVAALALLCPATQQQSETPDAFRGLQVRTPWLRRLIGHTVAVPLAAATADKVLTMVFRPDSCPGDFITRGGAALGLRPSGFITASEDILALQDASGEMSSRYEAELRVPGGILFGAADALLSPTLHGQTMQVHGLAFETLPGRGHMIPVTAPEDCIAFIRRMAASAA